MTDNQSLYPHNRQACERIREAFLTSNRAAIVHATGTGKSFIIENIARDYNRVLVIAPNNYVLDEVRKRDIKAEFLTYPSLLPRLSFTPDAYDLIVLDEFHRTGAEYWGTKVQDLLLANPDAKILGTTATEIRYLDGQRNMADELFESNVVSRITLPDAWAQGILPIPKYVIGLYAFDELYSSFKERIKKSRRLKESDTRTALDILDKGRLKWETSHGIPTILRNHLPADTKKMIVFCDRIDGIEDIQYRFTQWMNKAGFRSVTYTVHSKNVDSLNEMSDFQKDESDAVKVLFAINMLNEGIHVSGIDAIVMLRSTTSRIIQLQQMGRCMNAGQKREPVIFDLVDNLARASELDELRTEYNAKVSLGLGVNNERTPVKEFTVFDYVKDFRDIIYSINALAPVKKFEERLEDLKIFLDTYHRWPKTNATDEHERLTGGFASIHTHHPKILELKEYATRVYGITFHKDLMRFDEYMELLRDFVEREGRWPKHNPYDEEETALREYIVTTLTRCPEKLDDFRKEMIETYGCDIEVKRSPRVDKAARFEALKAFVEENHRWPGYSNPEEALIAGFAQKFVDYPGLQELKKLAAERYGVTFRSKRTNFDDNCEKIRDFVTENKRWPRRNSSDEERRLSDFLRTHKSDKRIISLLKELSSITGEEKIFTTVGRIDFDEQFEKLKNFVEANHHWPVGGKNGTNPDIYERNLHLFAKRYNKRPEIISLLSWAQKEYGFVHNFVYDSEEYYPKLEAFLLENKKWPSSMSKDKEERQLGIFANKAKKTDPERFDDFSKRMAQQTGAVRRYARSVGVHGLAEWIEQNGRWPSEMSEDKIERRWATYGRKNSPNPQVAELRKECTEKYGIQFRKKEDERAQELASFFNKNHRMPSRLSDDRSEISLAVWVAQNGKNSVVIETRKKADIVQQAEEAKVFAKKLKELEQYIRESHHWPSHHVKEPEEYRWGYFIHQNRTNPAIVEMKRRLTDEGVMKVFEPYEIRIKKLEAFVKEKGRWPGYRATDPKEETLYHFYMTHKNKPRHKDDFVAISKKYHL